MTKAYHTSNKQTWETPQWLFDVLDDEFTFTLDVCALPDTAKCNRFYTPQDNALIQSWDGVCWCNPPYIEIDKWLKRGRKFAMQGSTVVYLIPARTDTRYWWRYCINGQIRFLKGRLKFGGGDSAPFPSAIIVFYPYLPKDKKQTLWIDYKTQHKEKRQPKLI